MGYRLQIIIDFSVSVLVAHYVAHLANVVYAAHFADCTAQYVLADVVVVHA